MLKRLLTSRSTYGLLALAAWLVVPYAWWGSLRPIPRSTFFLAAPDSPGVSFSDDGRTVAVTDESERKVRYWDTATGTQRAELEESALPNHKPWSVAFPPDGRILVCSLQEGGVHVRELGSGREVGHISIASTDTIADLLLSPDGTKLLVARNDGATQVWDLASGALSFEFSAPDYYQSDFSPDGRMLATCTLSRTSLLDFHTQIRDVDTGRLRGEIGGHWPVCAFAADGQRLAICEYGTVDLWDVAAWRLLKQHSGDIVLGLSNQGNIVAVSNFVLAQAQTSTSLPDWLPDRLRAWMEAVVPPPGQLQLLDALTGRRLASLPGPALARFLPDGKTLATYHGTDGALRLWDVPPRTIPPQWVLWLAMFSGMFFSGAWWWAGRRRRNVVTVAGSSEVNVESTAQGGGGHPG